jgi:hypothetical protein
MAVKSMILKDLRCFACSILSIIESITYDFGGAVACKSVILMDLKSFRIILLRTSCGTAKTQSRQGRLFPFRNSSVNRTSQSAKLYYLRVMANVKRNRGGWDRLG